LVYMGFPFETVYPANMRNILMEKILSFLQAEPSAVDDTEAGLPSNYFLAQNYPNPFNPSTSIRYGIPRDNHVKLEIFDLRGNRIAVLINEFQSEGTYTVQWDGRSQSGTPVSSGFYVCHLKSGAFSSGIKMMVVK
ncbi:MAG: hypothetical protein DRP86_06340, partial [Candidatus Neomarinimicrobiota bacterium]